MKDFFKYMFATITGIIITTILLFLLFFGIIGAMVAKTDKTVDVKDNSLLIIKINQEIVDRASKNPMGGFDFMSFKPTSQLGLYDILKAIDNAAQDEKIRGIFIETESIPAGAGTLEEIRMALEKFKESGKFIISYSDVYGQKSYYLSSVSDKILLNPEGEIEWVGLRGEVMFYKDALKKLGIEAQIIRHGKFKSAIEPFILDKMSPENREQTLTYMGSIWNHWVDGISKARNIPVDELNKLADNLTIRNAKSAVEFGLIDSLIYKDQVIDMLKELTDTKPKKDINSVTLAQYIKVKPPVKHKGFIKDKIAVVYASGSIITGDGNEGSIASERFGRAIRNARRDSTVKAIVLRINSGGGSALASEVIWREVKLAKEVKPVIVSMGDVAASGGYYIAAPADYILANPTTITGSIGVFGMIPNFKEGMNKKLGITVDVVKTNKNADFGSVFRPLSAEERAIFQLGVEEIYSTFIGHVAEGRNITVEQVDEIGQGRVWSGVNAMDINLIDEFGGIQRAIEIAAERAGLENYRITELPKQADPFEAFVKQLTGGAKANILKNELGDNYKYIERLKNIATSKGIIARIPYDIELY
ncbi:MAG: signal peptide peptidase SppA [Bacteroidales bacterium]|nr:signal peptide peptidase SppA [Bacteroidales bacterium]